MKHIFSLFLSGFISFNTLASKDVSKTHDIFIADLLKQQTKQQISVRRSVSSILSRYPEKIDMVLSASLRLYPNDFEQIMLGALDAEPVLASEVMEHFLSKNVASGAKLIEIIVKAEPAYAQEVLKAAAIHSPDNIQELVRITIQTEPLHSKDIMSKTMMSFPERMGDILAGLITAIPQKVSQWVSHAFNLFPDDGEEIVTTAISSTNANHNKAILDAAVNAGLEKKVAHEVAIRAGATLVSITPQ